ncbi:MAG: prepilin peptidase [Candidatus Pacebacteria bacterium]|nr:prepilin peptidase [Candidatus Paceibacterota bacterium]
MFSLWIIANGLFGLIIGSFLNVVVLRSFTGRSLQGRSGCLSCGGTLSAAMLVPVLSWLAMRRQCAHCGSRIALQYPLVELATAVGFATVAGMGFVVSVHIAALTLVAFWILIAAYDIRHTIVPDAWAYGAFVAALAVTLLMTPPTGWLFVALGALAPAVPLLFLWTITSGRAMGFGDVKLALSMGALLGPVYGVAAVFLAFVIGAVVSVCVLLPWPYYERLYTYLMSPRLRRYRGGFTMNSEVPFGPFLIAGAFIVWLQLTYQLHLPLIDLFLLPLIG